MAKLAAFLLTLGLFAGAFTAFAIPARATTQTFDLYGSATGGWGLSASSEGAPGPTLTVQTGDTVMITVHSSDGVSHEFFIDLNGNRTADPGEPASPVFSTTATVPTFTAPAAGTYAYYCLFHEGAMHGSFVVQSAGTSGGNTGGTTTSGSAGINPLLIVGVVAVVVVLAAVGFVMLRRKK